MVVQQKRRVCLAILFEILLLRLTLLYSRLEPTRKHVAGKSGDPANSSGSHNSDYPRIFHFRIFAHFVAVCYVNEKKNRKIYSFLLTPVRMVEGDFAALEFWPIHVRAIGTFVIEFFWKNFPRLMVPTTEHSLQL